MPFVTINDVRYHYEITGDGPPLVLLHGFTGSLENWQTHVPALAADFAVLTVDLLGHGSTDAPEDAKRYGMEQAAADLIALIEAVAEPPVNLLGYSMGGRLALFMALTYPDHVASLILESTSPGLSDADARAKRVRQDEALADRIELVGIEAFVDYWENIALFASQKRLPDVTRRGVREQRLRNRVRGLANSLRGMGTGVQPSLWQRLNDASMPILLLAGALDTKFVGIAREMYDLLPAARLAIVPDAGHTIHLESPDVFRALVTEFLTRQQGESC